MPPYHIRPACSGDGDRAGLVVASLGQDCSNCRTMSLLPKRADLRCINKGHFPENGGTQNCHLIPKKHLYNAKQAGY
jgi:hypothetical protein